MCDLIPSRMPIRSTVGRPDARGKIVQPGRAASISFLSDAPCARFVPRGSGRVGALASPRKSTARRSAKNRRVGRERLFRVHVRARNKTARRMGIRDIAPASIIAAAPSAEASCARSSRECARAHRTSDGDVSRFTAPGPLGSNGALRLTA